MNSRNLKRLYLNPFFLASFFVLPLMELDVMPKVKDPKTGKVKNFPYSKAGKAAAKRATAKMKKNKPAGKVRRKATKRSY